ncbi:phosphotransferase [Citricoccus sp. GCM10030269]|uniref:phosphotransferase n=1 Tax=Citricoccus sp. GCM10030269 TaxID=3273388 RepID=UPI003619BD05
MTITTPGTRKTGNRTPITSAAVQAVLDHAQVRVVGQARTAAELRAEEILGAVEMWRDRTLWYCPVTGGLQNSNWQIAVEGDPVTYFLKVPGMGTEEYVDRALTNVVGRTAGELGVGPRSIYHDADSGAEIIEFLEGYRACTTGDMKDPAIVSQAIGLYRTLHASPPIGTRKTIFDMIDEHVEQVDQFDVPLPSIATTVHAEAWAARAAIEASGLDFVLCQNDPMPGNFLLSDGRPLKMVDYEFGGDNDRCSELGLFAQEMFFDDERVNALVEEYFGTADRSLVARVHVNMALADTKWGTWGCLYAKLQNNWDYDYHKYGVWKLSRARAKMADPRWGTWLSLV